MPRYPFSVWNGAPGTKTSPPKGIPARGDGVMGIITTLDVRPRRGVDFYTGPVPKRTMPSPTAALPTDSAKAPAKAAAPTAATGTSGRAGAEGSLGMDGAAAFTPPKFKASAGAAHRARVATFMFCLMQKGRGP